MSPKSKQPTKVHEGSSSKHRSETLLGFEERFSLLGVLRVSGYLFLLLSVIGLINPEWRLWGFHHLAFLPLPTSLVLLAVGGTLLSPHGSVVIEKLYVWLKLFAHRPAWLWAIFAFAVFFGLRVSVPLLGDAQLWIRELTWIGELSTQSKDIPVDRTLKRKEPLSLAAHEGVFDLMRRMKPMQPDITAGSDARKQRESRLNYFRDTAQASYAYMSMIAGALLILLLIGFIRRRVPREGRVLFMLMMLSGGGILLFFGYIENYTWTSLLVVACMLAGIEESLPPRRLPWKTVLLFVIAVGFHYSAIILLPGVLLLLINLHFQQRDIERNKPDAPLVRMRILTIVFVVLGLAGYVWVEGWRGWISVIPLLPQWSNDGYSFVSVAHWLDLFNLFCLTAIAAIAARFSLRPAQSASHAENTLNGFLGLTAGCGVVFVIVFNPNLGMGRDWDVYVPALWPLITAAAWGVAQLKSVNRIALISALSGILLLSALPSVLVNHLQQPSIDRFKTLLAIDESRSAYGWENLALHYQKQGDIANRVEAWRRAVEVSRNPRYVFNYADALKLADRLEEAVPFYIEAARAMKDSETRVYREQLFFTAAALIAKEKFSRAREVLEVALELMPGNENGERLMRMLDDAARVDSLIDLGKLDSARAAVITAQGKDPENSYWEKILNKLTRLESAKAKTQ
jgi:hypothetical protein